MAGEQDATVFTFAQANSHICVGKKASFYCMVPIEETSTEVSGSNETDDNSGALPVEEQEENNDDEYISPIKELTYEASEPKCIKAGCDNKQASGSSYCYLHKPYTSSGTSHSSSSYSNKSSGSTSSKSSTSNSGSSSINNNKSNSINKSSYSSTKKSTTTKKSTYDSYDDGYDDNYMDGDYDYDRYNSDYADGVDNAMDEYGEDW